MCLSVWATTSNDSLFYYKKASLVAYAVKGGNSKLHRLKRVMSACKYNGSVQVASLNMQGSGRVVCFSHNMDVL